MDTGTHGQRDANPVERIENPSELNDIEHIWKYVKGASLANFDFGDTSSLHQAIAEVFDELNSNPESDLTLRFRDALSKNLLKVA